MLPLEIIAHLAAIGTAAVALATAGWFWLDARSKRKRLESYLKEARGRGKGKGQRTVLHLMARLGLTEAEILHASFRSKVIVRLLDKDPETGFATVLLLQYGD